MKLQHRPILLRLWRILRMALGLIFSRRELWTIVEGDSVADAVIEARYICPYPAALSMVKVNQLPGYRNRWRVHFFYKGQP